MKKYYIFILFLFIFTGSVYSQFDAQISQYMLHNSSFNPAAVGEGEMIDVIGQQRINWLNFPGGGGSTTLFSINSPLKLGNSVQGIGLSFLKDKFGGLSNQAFHLQYSFKKNIGKGRLSLGTDIGFVNVAFSGDSVARHNINIGEYHKLSADPAIPITNVSGTSFDMSLGAWFSMKNWYSGISFQHLNQPVVDWSNTAQFSISNALYATGGFDYKLQNEKYVLKPSMLLKTDFSSWQLDLTSRLEYNNKYWGGLTYRWQDAVVLMAGINIAGGVTLGYSFDISTNKLITTNYGSHEFILIYSFEYVFNKNSKKFKSVRFL